MKTILYGAAATFAAVLAAVPSASGADIKLIASNAVREPYGELIPAFEKATGHRVNIIWGGTVDIVKRVGGGEVVDIVIIPGPAIDNFIAQGKLVAGSRADVARSGVGVAVRAGLPKPDISSQDALRKALLAAKSIVLSSGPSSVYLPGLFQRMGIADQLKPKITQIGPGLSVGEAVARGEGDMGFTQVSELMSVKGVDFLGPLPADIQQVTVFSAGLHAAAPAPDAAKALMRFLLGPDAAPVLRHHGMEPG
jgi:molybdate transport system substrate-binding protein